MHLYTSINKKCLIWNCWSTNGLSATVVLLYHEYCSNGACNCNHNHSLSLTFGFFSSFPSFCSFFVDLLLFRFIPGSIVRNWKLIFDNFFLSRILTVQKKRRRNGSAYGQTSAFVVSSFAMQSNFFFFFFMFTLNYFHSIIFVVAAIILGVFVVVIVAVCTVPFVFDFRSFVRSFDSISFLNPYRFFSAIFFPSFSSFVFLHWTVHKWVS